MSSELSWGLTVCTYNRPQFLTECIKYALKQTRLPNEIVIVDASDFWEETYNTIKTTHAEAWNKINLVYQPATVRSLPHQRNQALSLSQSDIIFSLDDDIYMFEDTAEVIMQGYESDENEEVAMIGAHFVEAHPNTVDQSTYGKDIISSVVPSMSLSQKIKQSLEDQLTLAKHFVAYDKPIGHDKKLSKLESLGIIPGDLINGGRTTFRRRFANKVGWSNFIRYYATHEDSDFSYRMSSQGGLYVAPLARLFHADGNERPFKRFKVNLIRVSNLMALHRVHSPNKLKSSWRLLCAFLKYICLYLIIDLLQKRFSFPVVRAYLTGIILIPFYMFFPFKDFSSWYVDWQEKMYNQR